MARDYDHLFKLLIIGDSELKSARCGQRSLSLLKTWPVLISKTRKAKLSKKM